VKSHQDNKVYEALEMTLDAYLNSEADELATIGLKRLQEAPTVPMDPHTGHHTISYRRTNNNTRLQENRKINNTTTKTEKILL
jgi:hypothetical protein